MVRVLPYTATARIHRMPKTVMQTVVKQLKDEQARLKKELNGVSAALTAFGRVYLGGAKPVKRRTISAAGRKRIAAAQRARWAKVKASQKITEALTQSTS